MSADTRELDPLFAPLATEVAPVVPTTTRLDEAAVTSTESTALAAVSPAERRVQEAKQRLTRRIHALDQRARFVAKQTAWLAGALLLGLAGAAVAGSMLGRAAFGGKRRRSRNTAYESPRRGPGVGTALMLAAIGLISRRVGR
jgi:hypothetical protein